MAAKSIQDPLSLLIQLLFGRVQTVFEFDLETLWNIGINYFFVISCGEWIIDLISIECFLHREISKS